MIKLIQGPGSNILIDSLEKGITLQSVLIYYIGMAGLPQMEKMTRLGSTPAGDY